MSTPILDMARSAFSTTAFAQLVSRLRHTNARYNQIALQFRCRMRPTHHAKRHAYRAGLRIDTSKARACPSKYVSTHPPPVLDRSPAVGPRATVPHDTHVTRMQRRRNSRPRLVLRLPPLQLHLDFTACDAYQVPGAPRLAPRQLPEDDCADDISLPSSSDASPDSCLPSVYSGLCITIPPRALKRKLHDYEPDGNATYPQQPKRILKARWNESQRN